MTRTISEFEIADMLPIALTFIVTGIAIAFGLNVMGDTQDQFGVESCADRTDGYINYNTTNNYCYNGSGVHKIPGDQYFNSTGDAMEATAKIPSKMPLIATVVIAALIIGILIRYLMVKYN